MNKDRYIQITLAIGILCGLASVAVFSGVGLSVAKLMDPAFYTELAGPALIPLLAALALFGVSMGALFSGARFMGKFAAMGLCAISGLVITIVGAMFFWNQVSTYTIIAFGVFIGIAITSISASNARGTLFGIGSDAAKQVLTITAIIAFVGTLLLIQSNTDYYNDRLTAGVTGITMMSAENMDDSVLEGMVRDAAGPQLTWDEFLVQAQVPDYDALPAAQQSQVQTLYQNYTADYDAAITKAVAESKTRMAASGDNAAQIMDSMPFFQSIRDNVALVYAATLASLVVFMQSIFIAPIAGATSYLLQFRLPKNEQPVKKGEVLDVAWTSEGGRPS